jgi:hypothetical protein
MSEAYLMLGVDPQGRAQVAIVLGSDQDGAKKAFRKRFPKTTVISWPSLSDLRRSTAMMELAEENPRHPEITCAVIQA